MKKLILTIALITAMANASEKLTPTHYLDGEWHVCDSYTTDVHGDTVKETSYYGTTITHYYDKKFGFEQTHLVNITGETQFDYYRESYVIHDSSRHEMRHIVSGWSKYDRKKTYFMRSTYTTLNEKGCPIAKYDSKTDTLIHEFHNDSLCHPMTHNGFEYVYDDKGRLASFRIIEKSGKLSYMSSYDSTGVKIGDVQVNDNRLPWTSKTFVTYKRDNKGRIVYVKTSEKWNDELRAFMAGKTTTTETYYKYFDKGNTTFQCHIDRHGSPIDSTGVNYGYSTDWYFMDILTGLRNDDW